MSVSTDGKWLVTSSTKGTTWDWDVIDPRRRGKQSPRRFCGSPSLEFAPMLSPDGRWLAYSSDETGRDEVYVRSFPDGLRKWRVSSDGGSASVWSKNGRELIYQNPTNDLIAVPVAPGVDFRPAEAEALPATMRTCTELGWAVHRWTVTSRWRQRFLVNQSLKNPLRGFTVTKNWQSAIAVAGGEVGRSRPGKKAAKPGSVGRTSAKFSSQAPLPTASAAARHRAADARASPPAITAAIFRALRMSSLGSASSRTRSARIPGAIAAQGIWPCRGSSRGWWSRTPAPQSA